MVSRNFPLWVNLPRQLPSEISLSRDTCAGWTSGSYRTAADCAVQRAKFMKSSAGHGCEHGTQHTATAMRHVVDVTRSHAEPGLVQKPLEC
jgi:hypothetical protein